MLFANRLPKPDSLRTALRATIRMDETRCVEERLAKEILRLMGSKNKIDFRPSPPDYRPRRCPDITLARTELGWEPKVSLEDGLKETIAYFRKAMG